MLDKETTSSCYFETVTVEGKKYYEFPSCVKRDSRFTLTLPSRFHQSPYNTLLKDGSVWEVNKTLVVESLPLFVHRYTEGPWSKT